MIVESKYPSRGRHHSPVTKKPRSEMFINSHICLIGNKKTKKGLWAQNKFTVTIGDILHSEGIIVLRENSLKKGTS